MFLNFSNDLTHRVAVVCRDNKENQAIKYLKKIVDIEEQMPESDSQRMDLAQTYINICSVYSLMRKHEIALHYAE